MPTETTQLEGERSVSLRTPLLFLIPTVLVAVAFAFVELSANPHTQAATPTPAIDHFAGVELEASAAIVVDLTSDKTLYEKNADAQLPLASLTKVPLVLATTEVLPLESSVMIPHYIGGTGESGHFTKGETWQVRDIVDFTLIASSNDGAEMLAELANDELHERHREAPADSAALWRMNDLVRELGLHQTYFLNVSGLDLSETQGGAYGSARDTAVLFGYAAMSEPSLFVATARDGILLTAANGSTQNAFNTNLVQGAIPGLIMGKTGTTDLAGGNLAVVFDIGLSHPVVAVVLGSSEEGRFEDIQKLVEGARHSVSEAL